MHPKKWTTYKPEIATVMNEIETTTFEPLTEVYLKLLTSMCQRINTSYLELSINALITIDKETFATCPMLLCRLDAMELFSSLTTYADKSSSKTRCNRSLLNSPFFPKIRPVLK